MLFAEICRCRPTDCSSSPPPSISQGQEEHQPIQGPQVREINQRYTVQRLPTTSFSVVLRKEYSILTAHRETLTQYITFKRVGRGKSVLLHSVVLQRRRPASTPLCG
jgi:hypothetical protein